MRPLQRIITILLLLSLRLGNAQTTLKQVDVRETFDEMLALHVEHDRINPSLLKRSVKVFIEQFDSAKKYLLQEEVDDFLNLSRRKFERGVKAYHLDDLTLFEKVSLLTQKAITRARQWRREIQRELTLSAYDLKPMRGQSYLTYAKTDEQLKARLHKQLVAMLMNEKVIHGMDQWTPQDREKIFELCERRLTKKEDTYLKEGDDREHYLALHTLKGLAKSLDAHTSYFSPSEAQEMRSSLQKQFDGVGVILRERIDGVMIEELVKGSPAARCGNIQVGDKIVQVNGESVIHKTYEEVLEAMKGTGTKELRLGLERSGSSKTIEVYLLRERIMMSDERLRVTSEPCGNGHIGILTLPSFYEGGHQSSAERDMRDAIKKLKKEGELKGIILDLRENSGGFLLQAVKISGLFITKGVICISKYSKGEIKYLRNLDGRLHFDGPLIILTSRASASAAEIVAQALQDYGVALIVGDEMTYGKGTIQYQTVTNTSASTFYKVTVGRYYTVSGRSTQIEGVKADIVVPTIFSSYKIGERFLEYPLPSDQVASAFIDPLSDIDYNSRAWFQKNYLPMVYQPQNHWQQVLPKLQENSSHRLASNKNFAKFIKTQKKQTGKSSRLFHRSKNPAWGQQDLPLEESLNIMKDMIALEKAS